MYNKYIKHCNKCNKQFYTNNTRLRVCDRCNVALQQLKIKQIPKRICGECRKEFRGKVGTCCSRKCRDEAQKKGWYKKCIMCSNKIWNIPSVKKICCSDTCNKKWRQFNYRSDRINPSKTLRRQVYEKFEYTCGYCKQVKHEKMIPLQIHHIDNNPMHTVIDNLVPLCLSCHMKTKYPHIYPKVALS